MKKNSTEKSTNKTMEDIHEYIKEYASQNSGICPSIREICGKTGLTSTSSVHKYMKRLQEMGVIRKHPTRKMYMLVPDKE